MSETTASTITTSTFPLPTDLTPTFKVAKSDDDQHLVFGWANVSLWENGEQVVDSHGDSIDPEDLENAAYLFAMEFQETGVMHQGKSVGKMVESFMVTPQKLVAMGLAAGALPTGWWVGFHIEDDVVWGEIKKGTYKMFSIQGTAVRQE